MTDELDTTENEYIVEFASGGPKNYGYITSLGTVKMCVKGITLNSRNSDIVTFKALKDMIFKEGPEEVHVTEPRKFVRDPVTTSINSVPYTKTYRMVYTKRMGITQRHYLLGGKSNCTML